MQHVETMRPRRVGNDQTNPLVIWLVVVAAMVAATAIVGAATRLTGSGLSITEWQPILGVIPPLSDADWQLAFAKYKQIPQYTEVNRGMSLAAFQSIYWWEWGHRMIARAIGVVFIVPLAWFITKRLVPSWLLPRLAILFVLGLLQAGIGWLMVQSGLVERVNVAPVKLMLHLGCAVLIFGVIVWTAMELAGDAHERTVSLTRPSAVALGLAISLTGLIYLQVLSGALVAGHKAGLTYNTWPLMDGRLIPTGLGALNPWWINIFDTIVTVQFNHRVLAYVIVALALGQALTVGRTDDDEAVRKSAAWLAGGLIAQMGLGIWTLLAWVPLPLGLAHQAGALAVLTLALWHLYAVVRARRAHRGAFGAMVRAAHGAR